MDWKRLKRHTAAASAATAAAAHPAPAHNSSAREPVRHYCPERNNNHHRQQQSHPHPGLRLVSGDVAAVNAANANDFAATDTMDPTGRLNGIDLGQLPHHLAPFLRTSHSHPLNISWILPEQPSSPSSKTNNALTSPTAAASSSGSSNWSNNGSSNSASKKGNTSPSSLKRTRSTGLATATATDDGGDTEENGHQAQAIPIVTAHDGDNEHRWKDLFHFPGGNGNGGSNGGGGGMSTRQHHHQPLPATANLALCSVPGKKVRLDGKGVTRSRVPIHRDLQEDFRRIAAMGFRAVINLLDDNELAYLGAPWEEYQREAAGRQSMEIRRYPMVEGGAPPLTDIPSFRQEVVLFLDQHIQRGRNVICHCRGGVGRAGLVACCWLLERKYCRTAEDAIGFVRLRRSPKAIETKEQEDFIEAYAQFLNNNNHNTTYDNYNLKEGV